MPQQIVLRGRRGRLIGAVVVTRARPKQAASLEETSASMEEMASDDPAEQPSHSHTAATLMTDVAQRVNVESGADRHGARDGELSASRARRSRRSSRRSTRSRSRRTSSRSTPPSKRRAPATRAGLRGRRRRGPQPGAALGAGGARHRGAHRGSDRQRDAGERQVDRCRRRLAPSPSRCRWSKAWSIR